MEQTVYIKCEMNICVYNPEVAISDIASVFCEDKTIQAHVKAIRVAKFEQGRDRRYVISILRIIELIHQAYPGITVENEGVTDMVVEYRHKKEQPKIWEYTKLALVGMITLIGGGFAIMAYNNDIGAYDLFANIYSLVLGEGEEGHNIMELCYSAGLAIGIIAFYGHFGNWKFGKDPTPLEIEMRMYEQDIDTAIIKQSAREKVEIDVK